MSTCFGGGCTYFQTSSRIDQMVIFNWFKDMNFLGNFVRERRFPNKFLWNPQSGWDICFDTILIKGEFKLTTQRKFGHYVSFIFSM